MNSSRLFARLVPLALLAQTTALHAAIDITAVPTPDPFPALPDVLDWSTTSVGTASATTTAAALDTTVIAATDVGAIGNPLTAESDNPPNTGNMAEWTDGSLNGGFTFIKTRPTGVNYQLLLATLTNATGGPISAVQIAYDYSTATNTITENVEGVRAYWSVDGTPGSWTMIPGLSVDTAKTFDDPQALSVSIPLPAPLAAGGTMYLLWADQNSVPNPDASYHIDNFSASVGVNCALTGSASGVVRNPGANAADPTDDTVSFSATVTGTGTLSASGWSVTAPDSLAGMTGAYDTPKAFSNVALSEFTGGRLTVTVRDADAVSCQTPVNVDAPRLIGTNAAAGNIPIYSTGAVPAEWVVDEAARTLTMTTGTTADSVVVADVDLSAIGAVSFSATLTVAETSVGSNLETGDRFKLELDIDGSVQNLVTTWDTGNGASAIVDPGINGAPDGYINGYTGTMGTDFVNGTVYAAGIDDYNANAARDEFNLTAQPAVDTITNVFPISFAIPAGANNVQIRISGAGFAGSETATVSNITIGTAPVSNDNDGDGVSNTDEDVMGTDINDPKDVLRISVSPTNPNVFTFPTEIGRTYTVQVSGNLGGWTGAGLPVITGDGTVKSFDISGLPLVGRNFFRLQVQGP